MEIERPELAPVSETTETRNYTLSEVRFLSRAEAFPDVEKRGASGDAQIMDGYAIVFNSDSEDLGGFVERVAPSAVTRTLNAVQAGQQNVYALWGHDKSMPLGSVRSGKLKLAADEKGLRVQLDMSRMTPQQQGAIRDGDVCKMSFGFGIAKDGDTWEQRDDGTILRTLNDIHFWEVSPVLLPAYPDTSAAVRSLDAWKTAKTDEPAKYSQVKQKLISLHAFLNRRLGREEN